MKNLFSPQPLHHTCISHPIDNPKGQTVRIVLTDRGILQPYLEYALMKQRVGGASPQWLENSARAVGLFYDYVVQFGHAYKDREHELLSNFAYTLAVGTVREGLEDPTSLWWGTLGWAQVKTYVRAVASFSDWCLRNCKSKPIYENKPDSWGARIANYRRLDNMYEASFLKHTIDLKSLWNKSANIYNVSNPSGNILYYNEDVPMFPPELFSRLISEGFRRPGSSPTDPIQKQYNLRDILYTLLLGTGGTRVSEPAHLWVNDILHDPGDPEDGKVFIHHPEASKVKLRDPSGGDLWVSRGDYLRFHNKSSYLPRNKYNSGRLKSGWKNNLLIKSGYFMYMPIYFFPTVMSRHFIYLYNVYVDRVRPISCDHPWLFVNENSENYAQPYSLDAYMDNFYRAMHSIGVKPKKKEGTTPHGLRYMFAQGLTDALHSAGLEDDLRKMVVRLCMHHKSLKSQEVYTKPQLEKIKNAFEKIDRADSGTVFNWRNPALFCDEGI